MSNFNSYCSCNMYFKVVQAEAAERRERNNDSDSEKASYVQRNGVAPLTIRDASSAPSSYEELYFMSVIPLFENLTFDNKDLK